MPTYSVKVYRYKVSDNKNDLPLSSHLPLRKSLKCIWHKKKFSAYLKILSKYRKMAFFFLKYLFSFSRYWRFSIMQIRSVMMSYYMQLKSGKNWINDISKIIEAVFLKLGTINVHHKRNKLHPLCCCHSNSFGSSLFPSKNQISPFTTSKVRQRVLIGTDIVPMLS